MRDNLSVAELSINASPVVIHRRQMIKQVWLPLGISLVIVLGLMILTLIGAFQGSPAVTHWGAISAILIIIPILLILFIFLALTGAMIFGMTKLLKKTPEWMLKAQLIMVRVSMMVRRAADAAVQPVIKTNTTTARGRALWKRYFH